MPNIYSGSITGSAPVQASVGATSATIVNFNANRTGLVIVNLSTSTMYFAFGANAAVVANGIALVPNGGTWTMDEYTFSKEAIQAIAHSANNIASIQELTV